MITQAIKIVCLKFPESTLQEIINRMDCVRAFGMKYFFSKIFIIE
jgi:hypothetical protein